MPLQIQASKEIKEIINEISSPNSSDPLCASHYGNILFKGTNAVVDQFRGPKNMTFSTSNEFCLNLLEAATYLFTLVTYMRCHDPKPDTVFF
jgi:hypothetical protein